MRITAKTSIIPLLLVLAVMSQGCSHQPQPIANRVVLPNGWKISPAGHATQLPGDMPMRILFSPDGRYVLVNTAGYNEHGISVLDAKDGKLLQHVKVPTAFTGMCMNASGSRVYLASGKPSGKEGDQSFPPIWAFSFANGQLEPAAPVAIDGLDLKKAFIAGLAMDSAGSLFVANLNTNTIYRVNPDEPGKVISGTVGYRPSAIALSPDQKMLAVAEWGGAGVSILDAISLKKVGSVRVGAHPSDIGWSTDNRLFVANAGTNTVSVIDVPSSSVAEVIRTSLDPAAPIGSTPIALTVDSTHGRLYVANADNNDVAVVDIHNRAESKVLGFIPTGWYPSCIASSADGKRLFIGTAKGMSSAPNDKDKRYIAEILAGHVSIVDVPDANVLAGYTRQVLFNTPVAQQVVSEQQKTLVHDTFTKIKHVLYIIKENRTYDQVLGDMPQGNGDPSLAMFGESITPNQHAMARQWVLLDNLYCNGEVSQDGHLWCDAAYCSDFSQKDWLLNYSKRGQPTVDERLSRSPGGYIWDVAMSHGLTFRTYGEREAFVSSPETAPEPKDKDDDDDDDDAKSKQMISREWSHLKDARDYEKADVFIKDLEAAGKTGVWPRFITMSLPENHTHGLRAGAFAPKACVASNDLALGKIVDAVTHSQFWPETAIFVIEDDAQNGNDHVDAHRTVGLVISPYTRRGVVDSTMYTQASFLRTMELILGLPPLSQYDAAATPMYDVFTAQADLKPFGTLPEQTDMAAKNPPKGKGAEASALLDFSDVDRADPDKLNAILWDAFKPGVPMPPPVRSLVFVR